MRKEFHYKNLWTRWHYWLDEEEGTLTVEYRGFEYEHKNTYFLREFLPTYTLHRLGSERLKMLLQVISFATGTLLVGFLLAIFAQQAAISLFLGILIAVFSAAGCCGWWRWKKFNYRCAAFESPFRKGFYLNFFFSFRAAEQGEAFLKCLQRNIAEAFVLPRLDLQDPDVYKEVAAGYQQLFEDGILTEEELSILNRKVLGGSPIRRSIGFVVDE